MASPGEDLVERLQEEASCAICLEGLRDPVTIDCGHNFCRACVSGYCQRGPSPGSGAALCPQCRAGFLLSSARPNRQLACIVEGVERLALRPGGGPGQDTCPRHGEKLRLFCLDDEQPLCLDCRKGPQHRAHHVLPLEDAALHYRIKLQEAVDLLRKVLGEAIQLEAQEEEKTAQWKAKVEEQRARIISGFEKRRQVMAEEEQFLLRQLQEEEQTTLKKLQRNWTFLLEQCRSLQELISDMENKCQQPAASLLKDVKTTLTRSKGVSLQEPQSVSMDLQDAYDIPGLMESLQTYRGTLESERVHRYRRKHAEETAANCYKKSTILSACDFRPEHSQSLFAPFRRPAQRTSWRA